MAFGLGDGSRARGRGLVDEPAANLGGGLVWRLHRLGYVVRNVTCYCTSPRYQVDQRQAAGWDVRGPANQASNLH